MSGVNKSTLGKVVTFVLEEWGMMMVDPYSDPQSAVHPFDPAERFYKVTAKYTGVFDGNLTVISQAQFAEALTKNLLGMSAEEGVDETQKTDSLREFANVISGNFLVDAFGDDTVFELPRFDVSEVDGAGLSGLFDSKIFICLADGNPVGVRFEIEG